LFDEAGEAEVHDDDLAAPIDHHVGGLQIAMEHAFFVRGGKSGAELARGLDALIGGQAADAAEERAEILAIHKLHGDVVEAFGLADVVHAADIGMRDLAGDADLIVETREDAFIAGCDFREKLEGDGLAEGEVCGAIDFAHAAAAEESGDAVTAADNGSGEEAALVDGASGGEAGDGGSASNEGGLGAGGV